MNDLDERINVRGYFERILSERDRRDAERDKRFDERYDAQEKAVEAALSAAEKATSAAFAAAKEAVTKAEEAQQRVNVTQNEFRGTLADQAADLMPRKETETLIGTLGARIEAQGKDLRDRIDAISGTRREGIGATSDAVLKIVLALIAFVSLVSTIYLATR
jgi:hypothetical protein